VTRSGEIAGWLKARRAAVLLRLISNATVGENGEIVSIRSRFGEGRGGGGRERTGEDEGQGMIKAW